MFRGLVTSTHRFLTELTQHRSPGRIAIGLALGTSLGFLPVDNLVWVMLLLSVLFLPVHQLSAIAAWILVGVLGNAFSVVPDAIGDWLLSKDSVRWFVVQLHSVPLGAWFRLNNTLVLGSFAFGLIMLIPNWVAGLALCKRAERQRGHARVDDFADVATVYRKAPVSPSAPAAPIAPSTALAPVAPRAPATVPPTRSEPIATEFVSTAETSLESTSRSLPLSLRIDPPHQDFGLVPAEESHCSDQLAIRETFIELVRLRVPQPHPSSPTNDRTDAMLLETKTPSAPLPESPSGLRADGDESNGMISNDSKTTRYSPAHQQLSGPKSSNSLRFLLRHLTSHRGGHESQETQA